MEKLKWMKMQYYKNENEQHQHLSCVASIQTLAISFLMILKKRNLPFFSTERIINRYSYSI